MEPIIKSLLDTDFYKITMGQFVLNNFSDIDVKYRFINRGKTIFPKDFASHLQDQIQKMASLSASGNTIAFLEQRYGHFFDRTYLAWLKEYRFNPEEVSIRQVGKNLEIEILGPWFRTIYWEVPLMAIISELFFSLLAKEPDEHWVEIASEKGRILKEAGIRWADFGTRRRYSGKVQEEVLKACLPYVQTADEGGLVGTSNVELAYQLGLGPTGTMAHELTMVLGAVYGYPSANELAMNKWMDEFDGYLGIALPDTYTTDVFLRDFGYKLAKQFDGLRHDSGDPFEFTDKVIAHYNQLGIDPKSKTIIFSDGLDTARVLEIAKYREESIQRSFGIGTSFTNDVGATPLNMVIKTFEASRDGHPWYQTVKISDEPGKETGAPEAVNYAKFALGLTG